MSIRSAGFGLAAVSLFAALFVTSPVFAWGCKGHQTVALIAEKHLTPEARQILETLLKDNPIDPQLKRYCGPVSRKPARRQRHVARRYPQHPEKWPVALH